MPRSGGNAASCHPELHICTCSECTFKARALLLLLRLSNKCLALDLRTGAAGSSSGSLCTSQRDGDLKRRRGLVGEVTGEVSLWTRVPNMVIIRPVLPAIETILPHSDLIGMIVRHGPALRVQHLVPTCTGCFSSSSTAGTVSQLYVCTYALSVTRCFARNPQVVPGTDTAVHALASRANTRSLSLSLFLRPFVDTTKWSVGKEEKKKEKHEPRLVRNLGTRCGWTERRAR